MKQISTKFLVFFMTITSMVNAQTPLKMGSSGPSGNGPVTSNQSVTLYENGTTAFSPAVTVSYALTNQQYGPSMPAGPVEGLPTNYGMSFGGNLNGSVNSPMGTSAVYALMNSIGSPTSDMYKACSTCGSGIDVSTDRSIGLFSCTDALISSSTANLQALNARVYYGDLTISFNQPVSNPILQIVGMGGTVSFTRSSKNYDMGFTTEFDLVGTAVSLSKLSGNNSLDVTSTQIKNSAAWYGAPSTGIASNGITRYAASGSVQINGINITSVTLKVYIKGDGGRVNNGTSVVSAASGTNPIWSVGATNSMGISTPNVSGDLVLLGVSLLKPVSISGNVFNDPNAGNVNNSTGSTNVVPAGLYANLLDASTKVVASAAIAADGTYSFPAIFEGNYKVNLSTAQGTQGANKPSETLPSLYVNTGEFIGTPNTGNDGTIDGISNSFTVGSSNITNVNFGINHLPQSAINLQVIAGNPGGTVFTTVLPAWFAISNIGGYDNTQDYNGGVVSSIRILSFPTNTTTIKINGTAYTSSNWPAAGVTIPYTTGVGPTQPILLDPMNGNINVIIPFAAIDNGGKEDITPGSVTLSYTSTLPVRIVSFTVQPQGGQVQLKWTVAEQLYIKEYVAETSTNGTDFTELATVPATASSAYSAVQARIPAGTNFYRIRIVEFNGTYTFSETRRLNFSAISNISVFPNPVKESLHINLAGAVTTGMVTIQISSVDGKLQLQQQMNAASQAGTINLGKLAPGLYIVRVIGQSELLNKTIEVIR